MKTASPYSHSRCVITLLVVALFLVGCGGGSKEQATTEELEARDSLSILADEVDDAFLATITEANPNAESRGIAFTTAERLVEELLQRERPEAGWNIEDLDSALRERRLGVEIRRVGALDSPWLLRISTR